MDKRINWVIVALIGISLIGLAIHTFVPRTNDELSDVEQPKPTTPKKTHSTSTPKLSSLIC